MRKVRWARQVMAILTGAALAFVAGDPLVQAERCPHHQGPVPSETSHHSVPGPCTCLGACHAGSVTPLVAAGRAAPQVAVTRPALKPAPTPRGPGSHPLAYLLPQRIPPPLG